MKIIYNQIENFNNTEQTVNEYISMIKSIKDDMDNQLKGLILFLI